MKRVLYSLIVVLLIATSSAFSVTITNVIVTEDDRVIVSCTHNPVSGRHRYILKERNVGATNWVYRAQKFNYPFTLPFSFEYNVAIETTGNIEFVVQRWIDPYWGPSFQSGESNHYEIYILPNQNLEDPSSDL